LSVSSNEIPHIDLDRAYPIFKYQGEKFAFSALIFESSQIYLGTYVSATLKFNFY